jgi:hypothetical protein
MDNHQDTPHTNYVAIAANAVLGDIPAPAVIDFSGTPNGLEVFLGQAVSNNVSSFVGVLEAESYSSQTFTTYTPTADAACSNGNYAVCGWSGTGQVGGRWLVIDTAYYTGRVYRPILRLRDLAAAGEKIYTWIRLGYHGAAVDVIMDCEGVVLPLDRKLVVFPPVVMPPWPKPPGGMGWAAFHPEIMLQAEGAGAHSLNIDFLQFMPTEGWLRFYPVIPDISFSLIRYDCGSGQLTRTTSAMVTHVPEGPGILLYPGVQQKVFCLVQNSAGMDIATQPTIRLQYRQRKRVL